jgi:hypothetical protein
LLVARGFFIVKQKTSSSAGVSNKSFKLCAKKKILHNGGATARSTDIIRRI